MSPLSKDETGHGKLYTLNTLKGALRLVQT